MFNFSKLAANIADNVMFVIVTLLLMAAVFCIALVSQKFIEKKKNVKLSSEKTKINRMTVIALLSALAFILMYFEFPIPVIAPPFYKIDFSEVPALIGGFMFGPVAGVAIEGIKILLKIVIKGTSTAFVGELSNFILGCVFVLPASFIYHMNKTRKNAIIGMVVSTLVLIVTGALFNALYLLPKYSQMMGMDVTVLMNMGSSFAKGDGFNNVFVFAAFAVAPFNLVKAVIDSVVVGVLYKYISRFFKVENAVAPKTDFAAKKA